MLELLMKLLIKGLLKLRGWLHRVCQLLFILAPQNQLIFKSCLVDILAILINQTFLLNLLLESLFCCLSDLLGSHINIFQFEILVRIHNDFVFPDWLVVSGHLDSTAKFVKRLNLSRAFLLVELDTSATVETTLGQLLPVWFVRS